MKLNRSDKQMALLGVLLMLGYVGYSLFTARPATLQAEPLPGTPVLHASDTSAPAAGIAPSPQAPPARQQHDTLPIRTSRYPGPPQQAPRVQKLSPGQTIELNTADTLTLQSVPGIGPGFARRIAKYRTLLGGYYVVEQLQEVYGMDRERYDQIAPFFRLTEAVTPLRISQDSIPYHPYLQYRHRDVLRELLRKGDSFDWDDLMHSGAFTRDDSLRLTPYLHLPSEQRVSL